MFSDVQVYDWFYQDIGFAYTKGLFMGMADGSFGPNDPMTRAMAVVVFYRAHGSPDISGMSNRFYDVSEDDYYYAAVVWASNKGIVQGNADGGFSPDEFVTRQQLAAILYRYSAFCGIPFPRDELEETPGLLYLSLDAMFPDAGKLFEYAWAPVRALAKKGIMVGDLAGLFNPDDYATRAQTAAILRRYYELPELNP